jgi:hypothetical protein
MTIKIPTQWSEVTLSQFEAAYDVEQSEFDNLIDQQVNWIAAITGAKVDELESLTVADISGIVKKMEWMKSPNFTSKIPKFFICGGKVWEVTTEIELLTAAQYMELCTWMKDNPMKNFDKIMATITVRKPYWVLSGKYDASTHKERAQLFREKLSLAVIYPVSLFFFRKFTLLIKSIQESLEKERLKMLRELLEEAREKQISS